MDTAIAIQLRHGFMCPAGSALNILAVTTSDQLDSIQLKSAVECEVKIYSAEYCASNVRSKSAVECEVKINSAEYCASNVRSKTFQSNLLAKVNRRKSESREI